MSNRHEELRCSRCGDVLDPERAVWLELNVGTLALTNPELDGALREAESQGCFAFGAACARRARGRKWDWA